MHQLPPSLFSLTAGHDGLANDGVGEGGGGDGGAGVRSHGPGVVLG